MSQPEYQSLQLVGFRDADKSLETTPEGNKVWIELPGTYRVGTVIDGVFLQVAEFKAGNLPSVQDLNAQATPLGQRQSGSEPEPGTAPQPAAPAGDPPPPAG